MLLFSDLPEVLRLYLKRQKLRGSTGMFVILIF